MNPVDVYGLGSLAVFVVGFVVWGVTRVYERVRASSIADEHWRDHHTQNTIEACKDISAKIEGLKPRYTKRPWRSGAR